ncbi:MULTISPECIES: LytTR family DNA-binding domain-containing protein [Massilia]|uniref:LytR/AlgR family response regulator transcription factor n=1 Tax=Massilia TaxID=149698 RepID=UPI001C63403C|nr:MULTISPECIES: LytTR family DNA-binding domain-containing protein [Massilia]QYF99961.1 LytTR family DNA-binding domain-containing protein [Massilia sp. NP310]
MNVTVLVAEDEPLMRERLLGMLATAWPEAQVVAAPENGIDAWDAWLEHEPQVVFLDIRMPGMSGLEVAERIGRRSHVVFVTAYDQYAVDAFDTGAVDYLLKPIQPGRLDKALARLREKLDARPDDVSEVVQQVKAASPQAKREKLKWLKASVGKQIRLIDVEEVLFFQADTKYTRVVLADSEALVRIPLKDLVGGLDPGLFWQIHRGTLVNVNAIKVAERVDAERMQVLLRGSSEVLPVSRSFTHLFRE